MYEGSQEFAAVPTFAVIPAQLALGNDLLGVKGFTFHPLMLLHGEQRIQFHAPFPTEGKLSSKASFADIVDKGSGALALLKVETADAAGKPVCTNTFSLFVRGKGGFGGPGTSEHALPTVTVPTRAPDHVYSEKTHTNQAAVYRLASGDLNPLHIDPAMARVARFDQPILHGLCTFGFGVRHVLIALGQSEANVSSLQARFSKPVFPGETLETSVWLDADGSAVFQMVVAERGDVVLTGGRVEFQLKSQPPSTSDSSANNTATSKADSGLKADAIFERMKGAVSSKTVEQTRAVFKWKIKDSSGKAHVWTADLKNGGGAIYSGDPRDGVKADCTLTLTDDDLAQLVDGQLDAMKAFMSGRLKVAGNVMLAQKLKNLF